MIKRDDPDSLALNLVNENQASKMDPSIPCKNVSQRFEVLRILDDLLKLFPDLVKKNKIPPFQFLEGFFAFVAKLD